MPALLDNAAWMLQERSQLRAIDQERYAAAMGISWAEAGKRIAAQGRGSLMMRRNDTRAIESFANDLLGALPEATHETIVRIFREGLPQMLVTYNPRKKSCSIDEID